ncbi:unnamed protein product [Lactuca saligna]|uniref:F-box domain-containing protein n=1 Tax=Lactuca saligna TaxID=75948 RepID=A0AA36EQD5_LACSI|nr:unnamed protein product [Lactuca saligna]
MEDIPVHVMVDILSRLHVKTIIHCKCVCKKWLHLVSDSYFINLHLSRSPVGLMIYHYSEKELMGHPRLRVLKWVEVKDDVNHHHLHHDPLMSLDLNLASIFQDSQILLMGSVNGLICLWQVCPKSDNIYICNPITREYMILPTQQYHGKGYAINVHCFGVSLLSHEYKVIRIFQRVLILPRNITSSSSSSSEPSLLEAEVYTLGTGQWRSLGHVAYKINGFHGPYLNGHAHWSIVVDQDSVEEIYAFDFDKETFKLFPSPPVETIQGSRFHFRTLAVVKGCLCQSDTFDSQFTMWVMKEYGVKKSWEKEVIIKKSISQNLDWLMSGPIYPIERLHDGTILMVYYQDKLLIYSPKGRTVANSELFDNCVSGMPYCPSFLKLQNFESERVYVF